ncbi:MAG: NADH-quinone oxidoreductase subunit H [Candidatus Celaenobacter antarcticus]|nr:NADH-quinone oxidoreductase subunit H [Candidatus Celaenobacter antarcticus]
MQISEFILSPLLALIIGIFFLGLARKIMARIHWRYGPPITQPVIDIIRMFSQKAISHGSIFNFGLIFSLTGSIVVILFLPIGKMCPLSSGGLLVILYLMLLAPLGIALSSGEAANPNSSIGVSRKFLLALGYEVPFLLILLAVMAHYHTISLIEIVRIQANTGWSFGSLPLVLSGIAYFLILPAILGMRPFEISGAAQEISSGPKVEFGGKFLAFSTIQHALHEFIGISLFVNLFLGGWDLFGILEPISNTIWGIILGIIIFLIKMVIIFIIELFINAVFPRFRIEQAMKYLWKWPTLLSFIGLLIVVLFN